MEGGGGRVRPRSSAWQHLLPCLLCQCDRGPHLQGPAGVGGGSALDQWLLLGGLIVAQVQRGDPLRHIHLEVCG